MRSTSLVSSTLSSTTASSLLFLFLEHLVESGGLLQGAREAIQDHAVLAVGLIDPVGNDLDDDLVRDEVAGIHDGLGALAHLAARLNGGTEHLPGGKLDQTATCGKFLRLRSLAGPRRSQQNEVHMRLVAPLSFDFLMRPSYWCASRWLWIWATVSIVTLTAINSDVPPK